MNRSGVGSRGRIGGGIRALLAVVLASGCTAEGAAERTTIGAEIGEAAWELPPELQLQLDSGNRAFRERSYDEALRHFEAAVRLDPRLAAGWYGIGMTQTALENAVAADSAMAMVHRLAPDIQLQHPIGAAPPNPHAARAGDDSTAP